jgi:hypothetical protein
MASLEQRLADMERRLAATEDQLAIYQLLMVHGPAADSGNADVLLALHHEDAFTTARCSPGTAARRWPT